MIYYKTEEEIELIRESSLLVAKTHAEVAKLIQPGITTLELDKVAEEFIRDNGGLPGFKGYSGFPNTLCVSPNEQGIMISHGPTCGCRYRNHTWYRVYPCVFICSTKWGAYKAIERLDSKHYSILS